MRFRLFLLLAITMTILPITSSSSYFSHAQSLPSYCTVENGETICTINMLPFAAPESYDPGVAEIPVGAKVIFKNTGPEIHTATSTDATKDDAVPAPNGIFDTGILGIDEVAPPIVMDKAGVFPFFCAVHPDMRGTLIVGSGAGATGGEQSAIVETASNVSLEFSATASSDSSITGGELPITKIRSVGGEAYIIDGITPAGGHDAFSYDGSGHKEITGHVEVDLNPQNNVGKITAEWTDPNGHKWKLEQTKFSGGNELYIGETVDGVIQTKLDADPVAINHFEHGTTSAGPPIEPTLFVYLASWGPAEVWKDGVSQGIFETHMMVTDGARDEETGKIVKSDGTTPYSPMTPGDSMVNHNTAQLHLVYHTPPAPEMTNNFPPPFEVFTHLMFYDLDPPLPVVHVVGNNAYIIDGITPAGGHDAFSYDGSGHKKLSSGTVEVDLDPVTNTGTILAEWTDTDGNQMRLEQTKFSGGNELYIGETVDGVTQTKLDADPVAINHFEHGTTSAGPPIEPTLFVYLASWGPAEVWKNGQSLGTFETHMMITDGARDVESGKIVKSDGTTPYSPMTPGDSMVNHNTAQLHLVYHTPPAPEMTNNFPPPFEVFTHLMFYDLDVLPNVAAQTPPSTPAGEGAQPGGGCLIATATYGSELAPQVQQLRELRDNALLKTDSGSAFMNKFNELYYSFSPTIADWERQSPVFKEVVKMVITPLVISLSILNYVDVDSEAEVLGYGISLILLNIGMYFAAPAFAIMRISRLVR